MTRNIDTELWPRGGADTWDLDNAGAIVTLDFFGAGDPDTVTGTLSITLGAIAASSGGAHGVAGSGDASLSGVVFTASGTFGSPTVSGTLSVALGAITVSMSGVLGVTGTAAIALGSLSASGSAAHGVVGGGSATLAGITFAASGTFSAPTVAGTLNASLGPIALALAGVVGVAGTLNAELGGVQVAAAGSAGASAIARDFGPGAGGFGAFVVDSDDPLRRRVEAEDREIIELMTVLAACGVLHEPA